MTMYRCGMKKHEGGGGSGTSANDIIERTATSISNDSVETIGSYAFYWYDVDVGSDVENLYSVSFPNVTKISDHAFDGCCHLETVNFPKVETILDYAFKECYELTSLVFPKLTEIREGAFKDCSSFNTLVLGADEKCNIDDYVFEGTGFENGEGTLYVPQDLISTYQQDSYWSTILAISGNQILPIENSPYENN